MYLTILSNLNYIFQCKIEKNEKCIRDILADLDAGKRSCECGVGCNETDYEVKTSSSLWPSSLASLVNKLKSSNCSNLCLLNIAYLDNIILMCLKLLFFII